MNCANHPERTATAFCQNCGKAICPECTRTADGLLLCEPCFAARTTAAGTAPGAAGWNPVPLSAGRQGYTPVSSGSLPNAAWQPPPGQPSPFLAGLLGFIPGVGAMYNGQFVKGLIHVVVFIVLVGMADHWSLAGFLIAGWEFYQVFDAAQTASARRDGRPLPDPFGLLDMSSRLGSAQPAGYRPPAAGMPPAGAQPYTPPPPDTPQPQPLQPGPGTGPWPPPPPAAQGGWTAWPNAPQAPNARQGRTGAPFGAIVLIVLGVLFLLNTLDVLNFDWIGRGWPLLLLGLGVWMIIHRHRSAEVLPSQVPPSQVPPPYPVQSPVPSQAPAAGSSLGLSPYAGTPQSHPPAADDIEEEK